MNLSRDDEKETKNFESEETVRGGKMSAVISVPASAKNAFFPPSLMNYADEAE